MSVGRLAGRGPLSAGVFVKHFRLPAAAYGNKHGKYAMDTGNDSYVSLSNFAVVGSISATYRFCAPDAIFQQERHST